MWWGGQGGVVVLMGMALWICSLPKSFGNTAPETVRQLRVRIIPDHGEYETGSRIRVTTELANVTQRTLCFPVPDVECSNTRTGSVVVQAESPTDGEEKESFICHFCGGSWGSHKNLVESIRKSWIQLTPGATCLTKSVELKASLDVAGEWRLRASYRPPEAAFGGYEEFRQYLRARTLEAGCMVPENVIEAKPVIVSVVKPNGK
jgi:hypothetical protein